VERVYCSTSRPGRFKSARYSLNRRPGGSRGRHSLLKRFCAFYVVVCTFLCAVHYCGRNEVRYRKIHWWLSYNEGVWLSNDYYRFRKSSGLSRCGHAIQVPKTGLRDSVFLWFYLVAPIKSCDSIKIGHSHLHSHYPHHQCFPAKVLRAILK
jgi:hypothetical protein